MDWIIIVAGGKGLRMGGEVPKQFLPVGGRPVLMRTIDAFRSCGLTLGIVLVLPREQHDYWQHLCHEYGFSSPTLIADGGATRTESVIHGLALIPQEDADGVVGVHDGVRPFVSAATIRRCYEAARTAGAAIPVVPVVETLRLKTANRNVLRDDYCLVQTPQCFRVGLLRQAYADSPRSFTDDASAVEAIGQAVSMVAGNRENIKLTTPFDLTVAEALVAGDSHKQ